MSSPSPLVHCVECQSRKEPPTAKPLILKKTQNNTDLGAYDPLPARLRPPPSHHLLDVQNNHLESLGETCLGSAMGPLPTRCVPWQSVPAAASAPASGPPPVTEGSGWANTPAPHPHFAGTPLGIHSAWLPKAAGRIRQQLPALVLFDNTLCCLLSSLPHCPLPKQGFLGSPPKSTHCTESLCGVNELIKIKYSQWQ